MTQVDLVHCVKGDFFEDVKHGKDLSDFRRETWANILQLTAIVALRTVPPLKRPTRSDST